MPRIACVLVYPPCCLLPSLASIDVVAVRTLGQVAAGARSRTFNIESGECIHR